MPCPLDQNDSAVAKEVPPDNPHCEQLVAVFDSPIRGLAPQQAIVLYGKDSQYCSSRLTYEGGGGGVNGNGGWERNADTSDGSMASTIGVSSCLGSAVLLLPGSTVFEQQQ